MPSSFTLSSRNIQIALVMVLCLLLSFLYAAVWGVARHHPYSIEYEGHVLWACLALAKGANIYSLTALTHEPYSVVIYNPLYFALGAFLQKLTGGTYEPLRLLSMASALVSFLAFWRLLSLSRVTDLSKIITLAAFAASLPVLHWSTVARVDILGLAISIIALERFSKSYLTETESINETESTGETKSSKETDSKASRPIIKLSAAAAFILAYFAKQQYLVVFASCLLFALWKGKRKLALQYLGLFAVPTALVSLYLQNISGGYFQHLTYASGLNWQWETLANFLLPFLFDAKTIVALTILIYPLLRKNSDSALTEEPLSDMLHVTEPVSADPQSPEPISDEQQSTEPISAKPHSPEPTSDKQQSTAALTALPIFLFGLSTLVLLYTMGLKGAYHNHLLCAVLALLWAVALRLDKTPNLMRTVYIAAAIYSLIPLLVFSYNLSKRIGYRADTAEAVELLKKLPKDAYILSEDPTLPLLAERQPVIVDATTFLNMRGKHPESFEKIKAGIKERRYAAIIINLRDAKYSMEYIWPEELVASIKAHYQIAGATGGNGMVQKIYLPANSR